jgi:hypothetical protein
LNIPGATGWESLLRVCNVDLQTVRSGSPVRRVSTGIPNRLGVVNGVHAQLQLRMVWIPTLITDKQIEPLGLDNFFLQAFQFELLSTAITHRNGLLA